MKTRPRTAERRAGVPRLSAYSAPDLFENELIHLPGMGIDRFPEPTDVEKLPSKQ
jgi:hypothetical protein